MPDETSHSLVSTHLAFHAGSPSFCQFSRGFSPLRNYRKKNKGIAKGLFGVAVVVGLGLALSGGVASLAFVPCGVSRPSSITPRCATFTLVF